MLFNLINTKIEKKTRKRRKQTLTTEEARIAVNEKGLGYFREFGYNDFVILLIGSLEEEFKKHPDGFYKHSQDREDQKLLDGECWVSELGWSRDRFKKYFREIGKIYLSPEEAEEADSLFGNKRYCSILNRSDNCRTLYLRNPAYNKLDLGVNE